MFDAGLLAKLMFPGGGAGGVYGYGGIQGPGTSTPLNMAKQAPNAQFGQGLNTQAALGGNQGFGGGGTGASGGKQMIPLKDFVAAMMAAKQGG